MNIAELSITILALMGLAIIRFGVPLLAIWLFNLALSKLAPPANETVQTPIS